MKKVIGVLIFLFAILGFSKEIKIQILGTADVHGYTVPWDYQADEFDDSGSYSQVAQMVKGYRKANKNVILVDAGDVIRGNQIEKFVNEAKHPAMMILNEMSYDVLVPGDYEFSYSQNTLNDVLKQFKGKVLSSNVYYKSGESYLTPSTIITKEGVKIGIIGVTTPLIGQFINNEGNTQDLKFTMPIPEVKKQVEDLKRKGANAIIVVAHMGLSNEEGIKGTGVIDMANEIPEIDVIIAGHEHKDISKEVVNGVIITEPYKNGMAISVVDLVFEVEKNSVDLKRKDAKTIRVKGEDSDQGIEVIYNRFHQVLRDNINEIIADSAKPLVPDYNFKGVSYIHAVDTGLSTLIAEAELYYSKADVVSFGLSNKEVKLDRGGIRRRDIYENTRDINEGLVVYEMTGKDLKSYMEWSAEYFVTAKYNDTEYAYNQNKQKLDYSAYDIFGGIKYRIDLRSEQGSRIRELTLVSTNRRITDNTKLKIAMTPSRYEILTDKGGPLEGQTFNKVWDSKKELGSEKGSIQEMLVNYIIDVKKGKLTGKSNDYWSIRGLK